MRIKVSVIVPLYNMENLVGKCLDSLKKQTYQNYEVVVVDDGSSDKSGQIADEYAAKNSSIRVVHHERNKGIACGIITGLNYSEGDYILFVDSDNYVAGNYIETLMDVKASTGCDIVQCNALCYTNEEVVRSFVEKERKEIVLKGKDEIVSDFLTKRNITNNLSCKLFPKDWLKSIVIPEGRQVIDITSMLQLVDKCNSYACISDSLYMAYMPSDSVSRGQITERRISDILYADELYTNFINEKWPKYADYTKYRTASSAIWSYYSISHSDKIENKKDYLNKFRGMFTSNYKDAKKTVYYKNEVKGIAKVLWYLFCYHPMLYNMVIKLK